MGYQFPWTIGGGGDFPPPSIYDCYHSHIVLLDNFRRTLDADRYTNRIVLSANACAGLTDEQLDGLDVAALVKALKDVRGWGIETGDVHQISEYRELVDRIDSLLAPFKEVG